MLTPLALFLSVALPPTLPLGPSAPTASSAFSQHGGATADAPATNWHVRVTSRLAATVLEGRLEDAGFDVLHGLTRGLGSPDAAPVRGHAVELVTSAVERRTLRALAIPGMQLEVLAKGRPLRDILAERSQTDGVPTGYLDYNAILAELAQYEANFPAIAQVVDLTTTYGTPPTVEGRHLFALKISDNVAVEEDEPSFMMVSAHHCREIVTPVIALDTIERLLTGYATSTPVRDAIDSHEIWIAPVWNPDGYNEVFVGDNLWRKNRRVFAGAIGVDLNRNYPQGWSGGCSGSTNTGSNTYKGPSAASEAETQTMVAWSLDQRFAKVLDFHSSGRESLWGYDCSSTPIDNFWRSEATQLSQASGYGGAQRRPSADGEHYQWQFASSGSMSFLTETHTTFQPSYASAQAEAARVWPGTLWYLARPVTLTGHITDSCTGAVLDATLRYLAPTFTQGEVCLSGGAFGRYDAFVSPGMRSLRVEAPGYNSRTVNVMVGTSGTTVLDVALDATTGISSVFCNATANSTGLVPVISFLGSTSVAQNQFDLQAQRLPAHQPTSFFMGQSFGNRPVRGGVLCVRRPSFRLGVGMTDVFGLTSQVVDLAQPMHPGATVIAGATWGFQMVYRDPGAMGSQVNYTPALRVTFCP